MPQTIILCVLLASAVAAIIYRLIQNKRKGKTSCGCGCSSCSMQGICHEKKKEETE